MTPKRNIKITAGIGCLMVCVWLTGCALLDKLTQFTIDYTQEFTIPAGVPANVSTSIYSPYFPTNSSAYFGQNGTNADLIQSCKLKEMKGVVIAPPGGDFNFIESIHLFLFSVHQPETEIAYKDNVPAHTTDTLFFDTRDVELVNYIKEDSVGLKVQIVTNSATTQEIRTGIYLQFLVNAKILGI